MKTVVVKTKEELERLINKTITQYGLGANLNFIDTSQITDMSRLFWMTRFRGDISQWDVSSVKYMEAMFFGSSFNGDIGDWNTGNVINMYYMFTRSDFNGDIGNWDTKNVVNMDHMFSESSFNKDISGWNISRVTSMESIFFDCKSYSGNLWRWIRQRPDLLPELRKYLKEEQLQLVNRWIEYNDRPNQ